MKTIKRTFLCCAVIFWALGVFAQDAKKQEFIELGLKSDTLMYALLYKGDVQGGLKACFDKIEYFKKGESWTNRPRPSQTHK